MPEDGIGEIGVTRVTIINRALADLLWPGTNAVGKRVTTEPLKEPIEVIGVVGNARYASIDAAPVPEVYYPDGLFPQDQIAVVVRTTGDPMSMTTAIRAAIHEVERDVFIGPFQTMDQVLAGSISSRRFLMVLLNVFSVIATLLALVGIAGMVASSTSLRIREVSIRVAMGATPRDVTVLMSKQGLAPAVIGLAFGVLLALGLTRLLSHLLYAVSPHDPVVFTSAIGALFLVSALTAIISAYRASRIEPNSILR